MTRIRIEFEVDIENPETDWGMRSVRDWVKAVLNEPAGEKLVKVRRENLGRRDEDEEEEEIKC